MAPRRGAAEEICRVHVQPTAHARQWHWRLAQQIVQTIGRHLDQAMIRPELSARRAYVLAERSGQERYDDVGGRQRDTTQRSQAVVRHTAVPWPFVDL